MIELASLASPILRAYVLLTCATPEAQAALVGTVTVRFDAERTTVDRVAVAITEAGFPAKPLAAHDE